MLIGYGDYDVSAAIGSGGGITGAAFLTPSSLLFDKRTGTVCSMQWGTGANTINSYVQLTLTVSSAFGTPKVGMVHVANIIGLPVGTLFTITTGAGFSQRVVAGRRREGTVIMFPNFLSPTVTLRIFNNVNGVFGGFTGSTVFAIGEIFVGGMSYWPTLVDDEAPKEGIFDNTAWKRTGGGQWWQTMRKPIAQVSAKLGRVLTVDAMGGALSTRTSGVNNDKEDARTMLYDMATSSMVSVVPAPNPGFAERGVANAAGYYINADMACANAVMCRPTTIRELELSKPPFWAFGVDFMEAT